MTSRQTLRELGGRAGTLLRPPAANQLYARVTDDGALRALSGELHARGFYLVTAVGTDERALVDNCFKITYLFSHPTADLFLAVEHPVGADRYLSLYDDYRAVDPLERELADLMGLYPGPGEGRRRIRPGSWLHECYPPGLHPLRRDQSTVAIREAIERHYGRERERQPPAPPDGEWLLPVGPVHAGVIEPGRFLFRLAGEVVEELTIRLGYTHKGIERLFQTAFRLEDGWRLAEHVSGDSAFAHSLAYCRAAEALAEARPQREAELLRGLFLEMERMANHVGDCGALAHDVAHDVAASELSALRERLLQLNQEVAGHRLLRGLNRPGGISLPQALDVRRVQAVVRDVASRFARLAGELAQLPAFRDRLQWTGVLTRQQALDLGVTGLVARASGLRRDFRVQHPVGIYEEQAIQDLVAGGLPPDEASIEAREATAGDALARTLIRWHEVASSAQIIETVLAQPELASSAHRLVEPVAFRPERNFEFGLGYVEGWRGDIVYWLMQDKFGRIYRCKVRDPSVLNWAGLKAAVEPHRLDGDYVRRHKPPRAEADSIVPDFPVINKSFNLSYSGHDL